MNKYLPELRNWKDAHFLTLTRLSVPAYKLKATIQEIQQAFAIISARLKKRYQRGTGCKIIRLRSVECNFNATRKTYNPHFYIKVPSSEIAYVLLGEWLDMWGMNVADPEVQYVRKVEDTEKDLIEVIKYELKIFTDPKPGKKNKKPKKESTYIIYIRTLDTTYSAMKDQCLVDRFGFSLPKSKKEKGYSRIIGDYRIWDYHFNSSDRVKF